MKLYLSSYRLGSRAAELAAMVSGQKRIGVIRNALDFSDDAERLNQARVREFNELEEIGLTPEDLDLRNYFGAQRDLLGVLQKLDALWVVGGNAFILRRAMRQSGLDAILLEYSQDAQFLYAGYSAGACVMAPTLRGIHLLDDPYFVPEGYPVEPVWDGLAVIPFCIAPHYRSHHPESGMMEEAISYFIQNKIPFIALRDGEVYVED